MTKFASSKTPVNEWTPGSVYWYEEELKLKDAEIARLRALIAVTKKALTQREREEWRGWIREAPDGTMFHSSQMEKALDKIDELEKRICRGKYEPTNSGPQSRVFLPLPQLGK